MTAHNLSATVTDTLGATDTDGLVVNSTASTPARVVRRTMWENRMMWGSAVDSTVRGPTFSDTTAEIAGYIGGVAAPPAPLTLSQIFTVEIPVRLTGCRIYKAPNATATTVAVKVWSGVTTGTELAATTTGPWTVDGGGWRQVTFSSPISLTPGTTYVVGYFAEDGIYAYSSWVYNAQDTVVWPFVVKSMAEASGIRTFGTAVDSDDGAAIAFPTTHIASNYYIDPQIEWDDPMPGYTGGTAYFDQWTTTFSRHAFPIAVYYSDPPYLQDYYDLGVNTLIAGSLSPEYIDAHNAMGNTMDWWPFVEHPPTAELVQIQTEEPDVAAQIVGYQLDDEPDMSAPYRSPDLLRGYANSVRQRDSTKPIYLGFGKWATRNQGYAWSPQGATPLQVNELWRDWASCADVIGCDDYSWYADDNASGNFGVWSYAAQVGRMREISDGTKPVWIVVETTSQVPDVPVPDNIRKAIWAALIAGARGVVLFDHRFASDFVTQNFAAMLDDVPMSAMMTSLAARLQTLGPALLAADLGLVTGYTSSNTTAGPLGGTYGVPIHYTSRTDGTYQYVFAQAIRPGATTGTLTIPSWAGLTVTVLDESRSETVSGGGVLTDSFAADYQYHLYRRTL